MYVWEGGTFQQGAANVKTLGQSLLRLGCVAYEDKIGVKGDSMDFGLNNGNYRVAII